MTNKKGEGQSSSSNDKPAEAKNRGWPKGKRRYPKVNIIQKASYVPHYLLDFREQEPLNSP